MADPEYVQLRMSARIGYGSLRPSDRPTLQKMLEVRPEYQALLKLLTPDEQATLATVYDPANTAEDLLISIVDRLFVNVSDKEAKQGFRYDMFHLFNAMCMFILHPLADPGFTAASAARNARALFAQGTRTNAGGRRRKRRVSRRRKNRF